MAAVDLIIDTMSNEIGVEVAKREFEISTCEFIHLDSSERAANR